MLKLHIRPSASADLAETLEYYTECSSGLPDAFLEQLDIALTLLLERPNIGSRRFSHFFPSINLRTWSLDRFPFRIFYMVDDDTLHILRVLHERRNISEESLEQH
jgi:toxin ParE1/3/4